jgi:glycosyltransferase involved in cell wall biosynthesis
LRLLILNGDLPIFPGRAGHEYLHTTRLARLAHRVGLVSMVHTRELDEKKQDLIEAGVRLYLWRNPMLERPPLPFSPARRGPLRRAAEGLYNVARNWRRHPFDTLIQDLQFRNISGPLVEALSDEGWSALIVVQSNCARWLDYVPRPSLSVLVLHDIRALVYERQAATAGSWRRRWALGRESRRYRHFEGKYCRRFDLVLTVSTADEAWVRKHYRPRRLATVPIPVDGTYFAPMRAIHEQPARILFTGMMAHPPNADAAVFFTNDVLPLVQATVPHAEFWIVGRDVPLSVRTLATRPGVVVTGFVSDIRPYIAQATVVVVPLRFGSGMRGKILEAWAMEKCVVSTRVGAEGLPCQPGVNILLADDARGLAARVVEAIRDPELRTRVRAQGQALVSTAHAPEVLARRYYDAIDAALRERSRHDEPLRAVIDLRWMRPGVAGGIENLSRSFVNRLLELDRINRYTVLVPTEVRYDFDGRAARNVTFEAADGPRAYARKAALIATRYLHGRLGVQYWRTPEVDTLGRARSLGAEIALSIPGYIHPDLAPFTNVLIVPDIQHEYCPEFFAPRDLEERRHIYTASAQRASHLCAISEFTRQTLIERLRLSPERISTTHLAADVAFHPGSPARSDPRRVLDKHGLKTGGYLLFPGNTWPHKNHEAAFQALRVLREAYGLDPLLVCTGSPKEAHRELLAKIHDAGLGHRIRFLGYCTLDDMPALYESAAGLIFPSLFEGFGLPLLEAMWCDCPIVCSNVTSLPEIAGDAALLTDPRSPEELAHALYRVLTDEDLRRLLIARGRQRVKDFSWTKFTVEVVSVLHHTRERCYG